MSPFTFIVDNYGTHKTSERQIVAEMAPIARQRSRQ
jgi:hypothetical protein